VLHREHALLTPRAERLTNIGANLIHAQVGVFCLRQCLQKESHLSASFYRDLDARANQGQRVGVGDWIFAVELRKYLKSRKNQ